MVSPTAGRRPWLGCELRLIGAPGQSPKVGNTVTSKCVGLTSTVDNYTSFSYYRAAAARRGAAARSAAAGGGALTGPPAANGTGDRPP